MHIYIYIFHTHIYIFVPCWTIVLGIINYLSYLGYHREGFPVRRRGLRETQQ